MGHCIDYIVMDKDSDEARIRREGHAFALRNADREENPDGHYYNKLTIIKDKIHPSYDDAVAWIWDKCKDQFYHDYAVLFRDIPKDATSSVMKRLEEQYKALQEKIREREQSILPKNSKAAFVGCPKCNSRLSHSFIRGSSCPLCGTDLRSPASVEKLNKEYEKRNAIQEKMLVEQKVINERYASKAPVKMVVKFEVHC